MSRRIEQMHELAAFILEAKRRTYAGSDDAARVVDPLLPGSKQFEYRAGPYAYRDIYFGMAFFVGQETVTKDEKVVWSMSYSGGVRPEVSDRAQLPSIYEFLRRALLAADSDLPYRGPASFTSGDLVYLNRVEGGLDRFHGAERISERGATIFEPTYGGGAVR